jgi:putative MATE family efflux protein
VGASSNISRALGRGDRETARRLTTDAHLLAFLVSSFMGAVGLATIDPLFTVMGATGEVLPLVREYMVVWYIGVPFVLLPMIGNNVLQATGDTKRPGMFIMAAVVMNIVLDPLFIFGYGPFPPMGMRGAALATVISRSSTMVLVALAVGRREKLYGPLRVSPARMLRSWKSILYVGMPAAATNIILPISIGIVTRLVSDFGPFAVAGFGVGTRVQSFALVFIIGLSMILTPFTGQNVGAGRMDRVRQGYRSACLLSLGWGFLTFILFLSAGRPLAAVFNDNPEVVRVTFRYLLILSVTYGLEGVVRLTSAALNGMHRPLEAAAVGFIRMIGLYIPLAVLGKALLGLEGIFFGAAAANVIAGVLAFVWLNRAVLKKTSEKTA